MSSLKTLLITGTDTGVGKTWITTTVLELLASAGINAGVLKPVCSGAERDASGTLCWPDVDVLARHCRLPVPEELICPQRFLAPLAPNVAAREEGRTVDDALLSGAVDRWEGHASHLVIEGAGGLYCPLSDQSTVLDLALRLKTPIVIVAGNRLGVISHTRLTVQVALQHGLNIVAIVLNEIAPPEHEQIDPSLPRNAAQLMAWIPEIPLLHCRWNQRELTVLRASAAIMSSSDWIVDIFRESPPP
jgi:dethiobiotin synthetase